MPERVYQSQEQILMAFLESINFRAWTAPEAHEYVTAYEARDQDSQYWKRDERARLAYEAECGALRKKLNKIEYELAVANVAKARAGDRGAEEGAETTEKQAAAMGTAISKRVAVPRRNSEGRTEYVHELPLNLSCDETIDTIERLCNEIDDRTIQIKALSFTAEHAATKKDKKRFVEHFEDHATYQRVMTWGR